ncbi:helix-turn-helix transcriptional regulator [Nakamurella sp. A5-74]|uniref:Helix-turn-helix transcriptional regulator n=1 Tax=Nakamurella sp. A5-74 TaxID=3158264 RepID=A0AAU8DP74_9ACTN
MPTDSSRLDADQLRRRDARRRALGFWVRVLRTDAGLTQEQLAHASGLDRTTIVHLEAGRRPLLTDRLWDLTAALNVTLAEFFEAVDHDLGVDVRSRAPITLAMFDRPAVEGSE